MTEQKKQMTLGEFRKQSRNWSDDLPLTGLSLDGNIWIPITDVIYDDAPADLGGHLEFVMGLRSGADETLYTVICHYYGCHECSEGAHLIGVFTSEEGAEEARKQHEAMFKDIHLHDGTVNVYPMKIDKIYHNE